MDKRIAKIVAELRKSARLHASVARSPGLDPLAAHWHAGARDALREAASMIRRTSTGTTGGK